MPSTIKISNPMAEALIHTARTDDFKASCLAPNVRVSTVVALMDRGLVRYDRDRTRRDGHEVHTLTDLGQNVRERLLVNPDGREFLSSLVKLSVQKTEPTPIPQTDPERAALIRLDELAHDAQMMAEKLGRMAREARAAYEASKR